MKKPTKNKMFRASRFFLSLMYGKLTKKRIPLSATLSITGRCNYKCKHCYGEYADRKYDEPTLEQLKQLVDDLKKNGCQYIILTGGEPLLHPDIDQLIDYIYDLNILIGIITNSSLLHKKEYLIDKIDNFGTSLDGNKEINDQARGAGSFDKTIRGFEILKAHRKPFAFNCLLTRKNIDEIDYVIEIANKYNAKVEFNFLHDTYFQTQDGFDDLSIPDDKIREITERLIQLKNAGKPVLSSIENFEYLLSWPFPYKKIMADQLEINKFKKHIPCQIKRFYCFMNVDGKLYPCVETVGSFEGLNVYQVGFKKAWDNIPKCKCSACWTICLTEGNLILDINIKTFFKTIVRYIKS